jgi:hypothetical protein
MHRRLVCSSESGDRRPEPKDYRLRSTDSRLGTPSGRHADRPACVLGSGPSLADFDFARCGNAVLFAANAMMAHAPHSHYGVFVDLCPNPGDLNIRKIVDDFPGEVFAPHGFNEFFIHPITEFDLRMKGDPVFQWPRIRLGSPSPSAASAAAALAFIMGCRPIYLLGWDYRLSPQGDHHLHNSGRPHKQKDLDLLRSIVQPVLLALSQHGADIVNVTPYRPTLDPLIGITIPQPYSKLQWTKTIDLADFNISGSVKNPPSD